MSADPNDNPAVSTGTPRVFLREPGWRVGLKIGSEREFCYTIAPGQDYYHRIDAGEIFVYRGDERLCLPCAERRGLLAHEPRPLRQPIAADDLDLDPGKSIIPLVPKPDEQGTNGKAH